MNEGYELCCIFIKIVLLFQFKLTKLLVFFKFLLFKFVKKQVFQQKLNVKIKPKTNEFLLSYVK